MAEWIYFIHPPRDNFAATMTDEEKAVWGVHFDRFQRMLLDGSLILVGPTLGDDEHRHLDLRGARRGGSPEDHGRGPGDRRRLRPRRAPPFRVSLLRGRDEERAARDLAGDAEAQEADAL